MDTYILLFALPGVRLSKIGSILEEELNAKIADIEDELKSSHKTEKAYQDLNIRYDKNSIDMESITSTLPRSKIRELWQDSVATCLKDLSETQEQVKVLSGHLIYYSYKRNEFYSVLDIDSLFRKERTDITFQPSHVILLIDDLFDMYFRLPQLYASNKVFPYLKRKEEEFNQDLGSLSEEKLASLTMGWEIRNLLHLLSWRQLEPIFAENVALQLKERGSKEEVKFLVWSIKQLRHSMISYLKNPSAVPIYLSHPISEPRRDQQKAGGWPRFVDEVTQLQSLFNQHGVVLIAPTGIDEYRYERKKGRYTGRLAQRWPLPTKPTLYSKPPHVIDMDYLDFHRVKYWDLKGDKFQHLGRKYYTDSLKSEMNGLLTVVVSEIEAQIAARDFLFVYHTGGLVVYRPYYSEEGRPNFSNGVKAEVDLWADIVQLGEDRRAAFIHFEEDIKSMLRLKKDIYEEFRDKLSMMYKMHEVTRDKDMLDELLRSRGRLSAKESVLNRSRLSGNTLKQVEQNFPDYFRDSKRILLEEYLINAIPAKKNLLAIWIVQNFSGVKRIVKQVTDFLKTGEPKGNNWEKNLDRLFPDELICG